MPKEPKMKLIPVKYVVAGILVHLYTCGSCELQFYARPFHTKKLSCPFCKDDKIYAACESILEE